ncbi:palindromic element RPE5 domain protein [Rickettsia tamurae subsp. buchneri]|uniref:Palindromic element RPE5 domain protein n=1 Tax=Rickettsia tamurae subsp. buchneri TaxID=1462938 RepID=A0A8E0WNE1_9RICK|nr:palindromic element RPE5 domain protein [Rickettsia tamurae subsp. buchneri]
MDTMVKPRYDTECFFRYTQQRPLAMTISIFNKQCPIYTFDTSKVGSQISGEPAQRTIVCEHRRIPKFDVPNLEVSKVYNNCFYLRILFKNI